jgi:uncharacterized protein
VTNISHPISVGRDVIKRGEKPFRNPIEVVSHRPWPLPRLPWVQRMRWSSLLFLHWPVDPDALRHLVPSALELDLFDGAAWVGITPFAMSHVAVRGTPGVFDLEFLELNVRTYVTAGARPGIWFFSLDASSTVAVVASRAAYRLPYHRAAMSIRSFGSELDFRTVRRNSSGELAQLQVRYGSSGHAAPVEARSLEHFLIERYCLYAVDSRQRIYRGEIHHRPWLVHSAAAEITTNTYAAINGIELPLTVPLCHYSELLDVVAFPIQRV